MEKLEELSLISKLSLEVLNHTGINDKTLAEFILDLHKNSKSLASFKKKLKKVGAEFDDSFIFNIDRIIRAFNTSNESAANAENDTEQNDGGWFEENEDKVYRAKKYPGLAIPDNYNHAKKLEEDLKVAEDTLSGFESLLRNSKESEQDEFGRKRRADSPDDEDDDGFRRKRYYEGRGRSDKEDRGRGKGRDRTDEMDTEPVLYKIYSGEVTNIKDFGAFVALDGIRSSRRVEGMVHISNLRNGGRVSHPSDVVSRRQKVFVKVMSIAGSRIGLSMKDADQETGADLTPNLRVRTREEILEEEARNPDRPERNEQSQFAEEPKRRKRLTSPERWDLKQLIASGVLSVKDYPDFDEDLGTLNYEEKEEELDIEIKEEEPLFLRGQARSGAISPIKIVKNPDGTLNRAALSGAALAKERRELKQQQAAAEFEAIPKDLNQPWVDPLANPADKMFAQDLKTFGMVGDQVPEWKKKTFNKATSYGKITNLSIKEQRQSLPIYKYRDEFIRAVHDHQVLVVIGDTGSGKTTQMTQYLAEEGFANRGMIGCTQPRRVAAMSVAKRVAEEVGCRLGQEVGYSIRFEDCTSPDTKIKYMTDGLMMRECLVDSELSKYSVIILDEAHERTMSTDVLFGLLKQTVKKRPDLKLIVTSATLDATKFSNYFFKCPILTIPGRTFPVEILYAKEPETDYLDAALIAIMQIHLTEPAGDILLFLTGQEEIDTSCEILYERMKSLGPSVPELIILPVYSALPSEMQSRIFEPAPPGSRKVVIATNIAETSITIDGIYYVVDPGFVKQNTYDSKLGMDALVVVPISQAQARQRAGRAGRTGPGKCYRLYTEPAYLNEMLPNPIPEIQRINLSNVVLTLKAMGVNDLISFDFMDPPPAQTLLNAMELLYHLSALDDEGLLTRLGRKMAEFPLEPSLSKMLISSVDLGCSEEILTIVAMLSVQNVFYRPKEKQAQSDSKKARFHQQEGDHLTLLTVYNAWAASKFSNPWCFENFIQARSMRQAQDIRKQLMTIMDRYKQDIVSCGKNYQKVVKAIVGGFFKHAAKKDPTEGYKTLTEGTPVFVHPSSALFNRQPEWVVYHELVLTSKEYMREVVAIDPKWLVEMAPAFYKTTDVNKLSKRKKQEKLEPLFNRYV
ncbi:DEAH-box ATP-dependent RNA helicase prp22 [Nowakowskiella sp. JEL0407]|nr:DEAH-box ATP-dependent RNA helicase prp22 [Nowakowskiella sp. JEL0407]